MNRPQRIVSLLSSATEILCALGVKHRMVAISHECDWPPEVLDRPKATISLIDSRAPSGEIDCQVKERLNRGEPLYALNAELLRHLRPDLIVTQAQCDVCAIRYQDVVDLAAVAPELAGAQVLALSPSSLEEILDDVLRVGEAAGEIEAARAFRQSLQARVNAVRLRTSPILENDRPRVVCIEWMDPLMTAGNWTPELIEIAGGRSGLARAGVHSGYISWERIRDFDPQVILIAPCGFELARSVEESKLLHDLPGWNSVAAIKQGRVYVLDGNALLNRSGPRIVDTLELFAHMIHPELFAAPPLTGLWAKMPV